MSFYGSFHYGLDGSEVEVKTVNRKYILAYNSICIETDVFKCIKAFIMFT